MVCCLWEFGLKEIGGGLNGEGGTLHAVDGPTAEDNHALAAPGETRKPTQKSNPKYNALIRAPSRDSTIFHGAQADQHLNDGMGFMTRIL
jgi:hypothetical protein